jgi:serine/threonine protein kinase
VHELLDDLHNHPYKIFGKEVKKRFVDFIQKCLTEDPKERWSAFQLQHHKWLESVMNAEKVSAVEKLTYKEMLKYEKWVNNKPKSVSSSGFPNSGSFTFN